MASLRRVCVFCGSSSGFRTSYLQAAQRFGRELAQRGIGLVYGGGNVGLMGAVADAAMSNGGYVIGVIPQALVDREIAHRGLSDLRIVQSMHERKAMMAELSDAFVALPGGFGTFEEWFEVVTWAQLGLHQKPAALLNVDGYYDPLLGLIEHAGKEGFISDKHRALVFAEAHIARLVDRLQSWRPVHTTQLIRRSET